MAFQPNWQALQSIVENPPPILEDIFEFLHQRVSQDPTKNSGGGITSGSLIDDLLGGGGNGMPTRSTGQAIASFAPSGADGNPLDQTLPPVSTQMDSENEWPLKPTPGGEDPLFNKGQQLLRLFPQGGPFNPNQWGEQPFPGDPGTGSFQEQTQRGESPLTGNLGSLGEIVDAFLSRGIFTPAFGQDAAGPYGTEADVERPNYEVVGGQGGYGLQFNGGNYTGPIWQTKPTDADLATQLALLFGDPNDGDGKKRPPGPGGGDPFDPEGSDYWGQGPVKDWNSWWANPELGLTSDQRKAARFNFFNNRYFGDNPWSALTGGEDEAWWNTFENQVEQQQWETWARDNDIPPEHLAGFYAEHHGRQPPWIEGNDPTPTSQVDPKPGTPAAATAQPDGTTAKTQLEAGQQNVVLDEYGRPVPGLTGWTQAQYDAEVAKNRMTPDQVYGTAAGDYTLWDLVQQGVPTDPTEAQVYWSQFGNWAGGSPGQDPFKAGMFQGRDGNWYTYGRTAAGSGLTGFLPSGVGYHPSTGSFPTLKKWGTDEDFARRDIAASNSAPPFNPSGPTSDWTPQAGPAGGGSKTELQSEQPPPPPPGPPEPEEPPVKPPPPGPPEPGPSPVKPEPNRPQIPITGGNGTGTGAGQPTSAVRSVGNTRSNTQGGGAPRTQGINRPGGRSRGLFAR